jgi:hypothetical protein
MVSKFELESIRSPYFNSSIYLYMTNYVGAQSYKKTIIASLII